MTFRELTTKWNFSIEHEKLAKTEGQLEGIKHRLDAIIGIEAIRSLYEMAEKFAQVGMQISIAAQTAGITAEAFQGLAFSASHSAVSQEELQMSLRRLSLSLYKARTGSQEAQLALSRLGLSGDTVASVKNGQQAMYILADRVRAIKDPIERAALVTQVLGRGSQHMVAFLSQGSKAMREQEAEARKLGIVLGNSQIEALKKMEQAFTTLKAVTESFFERTLAKAAPLIEHIIHLFTDWYGANRALIESGVDKWLEIMAYNLGFLWGAFKDVAAVVKTLFEHLDIKTILDIAKAFAIVVGVIKGLELATAAWTAVLNLNPAILALTALVFLLMKAKSEMDKATPQDWQNAKNLFMHPLDSIMNANVPPTGIFAPSAQQTQGPSVTMNVHGAGDPKEVAERAVTPILEYLRKQSREAEIDLTSPVIR